MNRIAFFVTLAACMCMWVAQSFALTLDTQTLFDGSHESDTAFGAKILIGDFTGNGFQDVMFSEPNFYSTVEYGGRVILLENEGGYFSKTPALTMVGSFAVEQFGGALVSAGDLNGDGCEDVAIGGTGYNSTGRVVIYDLGFCSKTSPVPLVEKGGVGAGDLYGRSILVDDLTCDGRVDLLIGAPYRSTGGASANGVVEIFKGVSPEEGYFEDQPLYTFSGDSSGEFFGWESLMLDGLLDGDNCASFGVGSRLSNSNTGSLRVYGGSSTKGIYEEQRLSGSVGGQGFSTFFVAMPSVVGNSATSLIVSSPALTNAQIESKIQAFEFEPETGDLVEVWSYADPINGTGFGAALETVDINRDGYLDLVTSALNADSGDGRVYVFLGEEGGLIDAPYQISTENVGGLGLRIAAYDRGLIISSRFYDGLVQGGGRLAYYEGQKTCYIGGEFYEDGEQNPANDCEVCNTESSVSAWSDATDGVKCEGTGCNLFTCQAGQCVDTGVENCDDGNACTTNSCVANECVATNVADGTPCGDGTSCTSEECTAGSCEDVITSGCYIDNACYEPGAEYPTNRCFVCTPGASETQWSYRQTGPCANVNITSKAPRSGRMIGLDGSSSVHSTPETNMTWSWRQVGGLPVEISDPDGIVTTFQAPPVFTGWLIPTDFELTVTEGSNTDSTRVRVRIAR